MACIFSSASVAAAEQKPFSVVQVTPQKELPASVRYPAIQIQFSQPVVPLKKLGEPATATEVFSITPALKGVYRWYGTSILSFESDSEVLPQKEYTIAINPELKSTDGTKISGNLTYTFHSEELKIQDIQPGYGETKENHYVNRSSVPVELAKDIAVFFNAPVNVDVVKKSLRVSAGKEAETIPFDFDAVQLSDTALRLSLKSAPPEDTDIAVILERGAQADADCYATSADRQKTFHSIVKFGITNFNNDATWYNSGYKNAVSFFCTSPLTAGSETELTAYLSTIPSYTITKDNLAISGNTLYIHDLPVTYGDSYTLSVAKGFHDVYGRTLGKDTTFTVKVPEARSFASFGNSGNHVLEPTAAPNLSFSYQNIQNPSFFTLTPLTDADGTPSSRKAQTFTLDATEMERNKVYEKTLSLNDFLQKTGDTYRGAVQFKAEISLPYSWTDWRTNEVHEDVQKRENTQIIQVTDLAITAKYAYNRAFVRVTSVQSGEPVKGAQVSAFPVPNDSRDSSDYLTQTYQTISSAVTDSDGIAVLDFQPKAIADIQNSYSLLYFEAKTSDDRIRYAPQNDSFRPLWNRRVAFSYFSTPETPQMVAFGFTDRKLYKPGETVSFKIIDRTLTEGMYSIPAGKETSYTVELCGGYNASTYHTENGTLSKAGTADGTITLPADLKPGDYEIRYSRQCGDNKAWESIPIQVQYFEKLRFEAAASVPDALQYLGDSVSARVGANYLGGGSLAGASYRAHWNARQSVFSAQAKDYRDYRFGPLQSTFYSRQIGSSTGALDDDGNVVLSQATTALENNGHPYIVNVETTVTDSGNQNVTARATATVHPSLFYLGISPAQKTKGYPKKDEKLTFNYIALTPDEKTPAADLLAKNKTVHLTVQREVWKEIQEISPAGYATSLWEKEMITEDEQDIVLKAGGKPVPFTVTPKNGGVYLIRLETEDSKENEVVAERSIYVTSSDWIPHFNDNETNEIKLTPDKELYEAGDSAQILLQSELPAGTYLVTVEREGLISKRTIKIDGPTSVIEVPVEENFVPVVYVSVFSHSARKDIPTRTELPKSFYGTTALSVSTASRNIELSITPDKQTYLPGEKASVTVKATKNGKPLSGAELPLAAVDRGVVDLIDYHVANPLETFYAQSLFPNRTSGGDSRSLLIVQKEVVEEEAVYEGARMAADNMMMMKSMGAAAPAANGSSAMSVRSNFNPTAVFAPTVITDKKGKAKVTFTLPDSLTSYRLTAVASCGADFGKTESQVDVANPVSVRTALPRKLRLDDECELGVILSNLDKKSHKVSVSFAVYDGIETATGKQPADAVQKLPGHAEFAGKNVKSLKVKSNRTSPLFFNLTACKPGWVTLEFTVQSDVLNEKILLPLEIEKPYVFETVTVTGTTEDTAQEKIILPANAEDGRGSLYIQLDPTRLGVMREAVRYVFHYPYGCLEQRSAAVLPLIAFGDRIKVFGLDSEVTYPKGVAEAEIKSWGKYQKADGGFPYWPDGTESSLYVSMRIAEIASLAQKAGINVGTMLNTKKLASYLVKEADALLAAYRKDKDNAASYAKWYAGSRMYTASYAYYGASLLGAGVTDSSLDTILSAEESDVEAIAFAALTYLNAGNREKAQQAAKQFRSYTRLTSRGIDISGKNGTTFRPWCFLHTSSEKYALALQLFSLLSPKEDLNQHIVYELLKLQRAGNGYWQSTAATARVLISLDTYIAEHDLENLDFTAKALLGGVSLVNGQFKGLTASAAEETFDFDSAALKTVPRDRELPLDIAKDGRGTLYYTASMQYALPVEEQDARDEGLCIYTEITDEETGKTVSADELVSGKTYREKVVVSSRIDSEYVAVRAAIPAGCEILNPAFVTTESIASSSSQSYTRGLSYRGIYDDEMQFFWNYFPRGMQTVEFTFRAVRKGTYNTPSSTAECMYEEEIFGRTAGKLWKIK